MLPTRMSPASFCLQGGYGTPRLLDRLDYDLSAGTQNPSRLLGHHGLHLAITGRPVS